MERCFPEWSFNGLLISASLPKRGSHSTTLGMGHVRFFFQVHNVSRARKTQEGRNSLFQNHPAQKMRTKSRPSRDLRIYRVYMDAAVGVSSSSALRLQRSLTTFECMNRVSLRLRWRRLSPGGASKRSPAICVGCFSLMPRRRSNKCSLSCLTSVCLNGSVWAAQGSVAIHAVLAIRTRVGKWGSPNRSHW